LARYEIDIRRIMAGKLIMGIGNARLLVDEKEIYTASDLRVGLFESNEF
jgi:3-hydroxyacyl-[acyl-carrier protein] dehydratase / trans-2-decenoyl-[acyl-carrier protein] isomerase